MSNLVAAAPLSQPIEFGKYTLFERIGRGGMADVFKGRVQGPAGFERVFVIKRILPHLSDEPQFITMFINEAKMSARLNHPNVVQIFELGNVGSEYFISMEYIPGRDLAETMRAIWSRLGPPKPELVAFVGREMCRGLHYAHELCDEDGRPLNIIHRDVSPSNVMLSYEGAVKLLDFGIAKALGEAPENTKGGTLKGKYAYMAPEQASGQPLMLDRRIDVFAAGIVLYELTTGRRLFKGQTDMATIERVRRCDVPPPSKHNPLCTPELDAILMKALAKDRDQRYQSAAEMGDALEEIVYSARFVPAQLRQLLADLFLGDTNTRIDRRAQSASQRAPVSSSSVPPVAVTATGAESAASAAGPAGAAAQSASDDLGAAPPFTPVSESGGGDAAAQPQPGASPAEAAAGGNVAAVSTDGRPFPTASGIKRVDEAIPASLAPSELMESLQLQVPAPRAWWARRSTIVGGAIGFVAVVLAVGVGLGLVPGGGRGVVDPTPTPVPSASHDPARGVVAERRNSAPVSPSDNGSNSRHVVEVPFGSVPEGAEIFIRDGATPAGKTPLTVPVEMDGTTAVKVTLKLAGYEDHQQVITSNKPVFVALKSLKSSSSGSSGDDGSGGRSKSVSPRKKRSSELVNPF